jgi:hypothetical protein
MPKDNMEKVKELLGQMQCPKAFRCVAQGFTNLCKARDYGHNHYLECLEDSAEECVFAVPFPSGHLCKCPLRCHIAKNMKK